MFVVGEGIEKKQDDFAAGSGRHNGRSQGPISLKQARGLEPLCYPRIRRKRKETLLAEPFGEFESIKHGWTGSCANLPVWLISQ